MHDCGSVLSTPQLDCVKSLRHGSKSRILACVDGGITGAAGWAYDSLQLHNADARDHVYTLEQLEGAGTHEDLWNAAQNQLVKTGKMHGFMCAVSCSP